MLGDGGPPVLNKRRLRLHGPLCRASRILAHTRAIVCTLCQSRASGAACNVQHLHRQVSCQDTGRRSHLAGWPAAGSAWLNASCTGSGLKAAVSGPTCSPRGQKNSMALTLLSSSSSRPKCTPSSICGTAQGQVRQVQCMRALLVLNASAACTCYGPHALTAHPCWSADIRHSLMACCQRTV